jgi:hypothetical protein
MNLRKMIVELEAEKNRLDEAILALERLSRSISKRRGRPLRWLSQAAAVSHGVDSMPQPVDPTLKKTSTN